MSSPADRIRQQLNQAAQANQGPAEAAPATTAAPATAPAPQPGHGGSNGAHPNGSNGSNGAHPNGSNGAAQAARPAAPPSRSNRQRRVSDHDIDDEPHYRDEPQGEPRLGRVTPSLQRTWIDPEETPFEPKPRPGNPFAARMLSWVFTLMLVGGIAWLVVPEVSFRFATDDTIVLRDGVLTAHPVPLAPTGPATVSELYVDASALPDGVLRQGTPIALLERIDLAGQEYESFEVRAPFDARFVSVDSLVGTVVLPGTPVVTLYDPSKMYVIVTVLPELLEKLRRGMTVELKSSAIDQPIAGTVISAVPLLGTDHEPTSADLVNIRIRPDALRILDFVPGMRFEAVVHLDSVSDDAQPLVFTNAAHIEPDTTDTDDEQEPSNDAGDGA